MKNVCFAKITPELLSTVLCLPNFTEVDGFSIDRDGMLILHISGAEEEFNGEDVKVVFTKQTDRAGRYIITSEIKKF